MNVNRRSLSGRVGPAKKQQHRIEISCLLHRRISNAHFTSVLQLAKVGSSLHSDYVTAMSIDRALTNATLLSRPF
jgi:hypothetical protein